MIICQYKTFYTNSAYKINTILNYKLYIIFYFKYYLFLIFLIKWTNEKINWQSPAKWAVCRSHLIVRFIRWRKSRNVNIIGSIAMCPSDVCNASIWPFQRQNPLRDNTNRAKEWLNDEGDIRIWHSFEFLCHFPVTWHTTTCRNEI